MDPDLECLMLDSTVIGAHQHAPEPGKKGRATRALRGGLA
jgi:hypothetical protein